MKRLIVLLLIALSLNSFSTETPKHTISGYVTDERGEALIGASVYDKESMLGVLTNNYGFFSLTLPQGEHQIICAYLGFEKSNLNIQLNDNTKVDIKLIPEATEIEEVRILAESKKANVESITMSNEKLAIKTIKKLPVLMGETDIIKSIQLLPGVQTIGEGNSGFFVRGGGVDQNLILLDDATVYNPSHVGGFFSVFNGDAVKNVELYKGGIPARYGGRLASVLDVRMKEGSMTDLHVNGGIGAISSRLTVETPIIKDKMSFIASGRRTYIDVFFPLFNNEGLDGSKVYFYDFNSKINYIINDNNRIFISAYTGKDVLVFGDMFKMSYGNQTLTARYNHVFSDKIFSNTTVIYSDFLYHIGQPTGAFGFDWYAHVINRSIKNDYIYYINPTNTLRFGGKATHYTIRPGIVTPVDESNFGEYKMPNNYGLELNVFAENEMKVTNRVTALYGLRYTAFRNLGGTVYNYDEDYNIIDSVEYGRRETSNKDYAFEPRLGLRLMIDGNSSVKASYNRTFQFIQLATNTASSTPIDIWFLSNKNLKPQYADQVALGYFRNYFNDQLEFSIEGYYKKMYNTIDFIDHAQLLLNEKIDGEMRVGKAYSYGLEFMAKKESGRYTGWISYTLSKTRRKIEGINNGKEYPAPYDKPHDIKIVNTFEVSDRLTISANWVYASPLPLTVPVKWFEYQNLKAPIQSDRNSVRLNGTAYHRLDIAVTWQLKTKPGSKYSHDLMASVYNVYNRHNLYSLDHTSGEVLNLLPVTQKMYLFKVIPTVTYNFKF